MKTLFAALMMIPAISLAEYGYVSSNLNLKETKCIVQKYKMVPPPKNALGDNDFSLVESKILTLKHKKNDPRQFAYWTVADLNKDLEINRVDDVGLQVISTLR